MGKWECLTEKFDCVVFIVFHSLFSSHPTYLFYTDFTQQHTSVSPERGRIVALHNFPDFLRAILLSQRRVCCGADDMQFSWIPSHFVASDCAVDGVRLELWSILCDIGTTPLQCHRQPEKGEYGADGAREFNPLIISIFPPYFRQVICGLACGWFVAIVATLPPFFDVAPYRFDASVGVCTPHFSAARSLWYAITFTVLTLIIPGFIIILCNIKVSAYRYNRERASWRQQYFLIFDWNALQVFMIARYHRHRIAAAIFEVTLSAQVTITHQRNPFPLPFEAIPPKLRSRSPMSSVFQIVGTFILLYCPYYMCVLWNSSIASLHNGNIPKSLEVPRSVSLIVTILIHLTVFSNGIIYGLKSKAMRKTVQNYWRKKKTKNEIQNEIQARTPSTCGSRRPSVNALAFFQRPLMQRRLSETFLNVSHTNASDRPQMKRIASELSWRPLTLRLDASPTEPLPHAASVNTLQIPDVEANGTSADRDKFMSLRDSIRSSMRSYNRKTMSSVPSMSSRHSRSSMNVASSLFQKMFRFDLPRRNHEPLSPLRSPQILITSAHSDDSDQTSQPSPQRLQLQKRLSLANFFEKNNCVRYEQNDKIDDSDTESMFTPDMNSTKTDETIISKRCFSLDDQPNFKNCFVGCNTTNNAVDTVVAADEQLLLSWPTTRKEYKLLKEYEPTVNPLYNDRCEEPEVIL